MDAARIDRWAVLALKVGVALQCLGAAWKFTLTNSSLNSFALIELGWTPEDAANVDRLQVVLLAASAALALVRPRSLLLLLPTLLFAIEAAAHGVGHERFSHLAPYTAAIRVAAPLALILLARDSTRATAGSWLLRVAVATAFVGHGIEAAERHPAFVDLLLAFDFRLRDLGLGVGLDETGARAALLVIAVHDLVLAALLLVRRWRAVALWMAIWGGCAALARVVQGGWVLWFEAALRATHAAAPLAVAFLFAARRARATEREDPR